MAELRESAAGVFERMLEAALRAQAESGPIERSFEIAGRPVRLRFAGPALVAPITRALRHRETAASGLEPELTVHVWDSASTRTPPPRLAWGPEHLEPRGAIRGGGGEDVQVAYMPGSSNLSLYAAGRGLAIHWTPDAASLSEAELGAPLRFILQWWAARRGLQMLHAGAVGLGGAGLVLAGRGGSGKSTTALACLGSGFQYAADDYCLLGFGQGVEAHSLYNSGKALASGMSRLGFLRGREALAAATEADKNVYFAHELFPGRLAGRLAVRALLLPRVTGLPRTRLSPTSAGAALARLAPSTLFQAPYTGQADLTRLARLTREAPAFALELGTDMDEVVEALRGLLAGLGGGAA